MCPSCGLVNLEKFVSFPNCAGCGARLPETKREGAPKFWRRRLGAPIWASLVGLICAALGIAAISVVRETARPEENDLLVYVQFPRSARLGEVFYTQFVLDTTHSGAATPNFTDVRLRLAKETLGALQILTIEPPPSEISSTGGGRYFQFETLVRNQPIRASFRAVKAGQHRIRTSIYARDFQPFHYTAFIKVAPSKK